MCNAFTRMVLSSWWSPPGFSAPVDCSTRCFLSRFSPNQPETWWDLKQEYLKVYFCSLVCLFLFQNMNDSNYMLFFIVTFLNFHISVKNTNGLMQLTFNWLNFFCISSIAFFKSSLSFWYIDWTFLTSFTWTKRWTLNWFWWRSSTWTSPAPLRRSPFSAPTSCFLFGEPAPCLCSQLAGCCSTRWCLV